MFFLKKINVYELEQVRKENPKIKVIDVRTSQERKDMSIPKSIHLPLDSLLSGSWDTVLKGKSEPLVVYCHSGMRSAQAVRYLKKQGFTEAHNLKGGILAYKFAGLKTQKG